MRESKYDILGQKLFYRPQVPQSRRFHSGFINLKYVYYKNIVPKFSLMTESVSIMDNSNTRINNKSNVYKHNSGQPIFLIS